MINFGVFGDTSRCGTIRKAINSQKDNSQVYGYCTLGENEQFCNNLNPKYIRYNSFEEMISDTNIDAIAISNCFCDHAEYAIKALEAGKHVLSEITAGVTPQQLVRLCEAVENSGKIYGLLENYAMLPVCYKMKQDISNNNFGKIVYAEGEYNHYLSPGRIKVNMVSYNEHWRRYRPCTFYVEHALGPLLYVLDAMPTSVIAKCDDGDEEFAKERFLNYKELCGVMLVSTDKGTLLNVKGCTHYFGHGRYYRFNGIDGLTEVVRGKGRNLRAFYNCEEKIFEEVTYPQEIIDYFGEETLRKEPHQGADLLVVKNFIDAIENKTTLLFDVYKACAMSAVAIYGWRSILEKKEFKIPNFRDKNARNEVKNDDLNPFFVNGIEPTLQCTQ